MVKKQIQSTIQCDTCKRSVETAVTRPGEVENFLKDLENEGWVFNPKMYLMLLEEIKEIYCPMCEEARKAKLRESEDIYDRITGGYYADNKYDEFKRDALKHFGLSGHPKADKAFSFAWEHGHASGWNDVLYWFGEIAEFME